MKGIFRSRFTLILAYILMAGVCVYLNLTSGRRDLSNIIVSAVLFLIVLIIFIFAIRRFARVDSIIRNLNDASEEIRNDFRISGDYLWEAYRNNDISFTNKTLGRKYAEFRDETDRIKGLSGEIYHCDIEDYINRDLIDDVANRNVLNLVSGTMTGLGILGTFVGLSIGLQYFNTGTADEIALSIGPLIEGIKIAFHTSIYGMVFSLIFSFIYKNKMDQAYEAVDRFLEAYENFVLPSPQNESSRQILDFEKRQAESMTRMAATFAGEVSEKLGQIMEPRLAEMNTTIERFAAVATRSQVEGISKVSDKFIEEMNRSLGGNLTALGGAIKETVDWQREDRNYMRNILGEIDRMSANFGRANEAAARTLDGLAEYVSKMDRIRAVLDEDMKKANEIISLGRDASKEQLVMLKTYGEDAARISGQMAEIGRNMAEQLELTRKAESDFKAAASAHVDSLTRSVGEAGQRVIEIADAAVKNISDYSKESAKELAAAYDEMKKNAR